MTRDEAKIQALKSAVDLCSHIPVMGDNRLIMVVDTARMFELYLTEQEKPIGNPVTPGSISQAVESSESNRLGQSRKRP